MPTLTVDGQPVEVPAVVPGAQIINHPEVQKHAQGGRTVFLVDPETQSMEIVDPAKTYRPREGTQIDSTAPSISGRR